jgi:hypothetical protein
VSVDEYLCSKYSLYDTTILHILSGEGCATDNVAQAITKAVRESLRVIILEHNPNSSDFDGLRPLDYINDVLRGCCHKVVSIDDRNLMYVVSTIDRVDYNGSRALSTKTEWMPDREGTDWTNTIYLLSSENFRDKEKIFSDDIARMVHNSTGDYYSVVGGMMFLNAIYQADPQWDIRLFDASLLQCIYAAIVCEAIADSDNILDFHKFAYKPHLNETMIAKLQRLGCYDNMIGALREEPKESYRWFNIVRNGVWLNDFDRVADTIRNQLHGIKWCELSDIHASEKDIIYTSTIPELPDTDATIISCYHEDQDKRDIVRVV